MPRFTLHCAADDALASPVPEELRHDDRVRLIGELPRMLLIESSPEVAEEWAAKLPGWKLATENRARIPDPRPQLTRRVR